MDQDKLDALRKKIAKKGAPVKKLAPVKKISTGSASSSTGARDKDSSPGKAPRTIVNGTNHASILCKCKTAKCPEYGDQKAVRIPMIGRVIFLPGTVLCGECMAEMTWNQGDVHVDRY